MSYNKVTTKEIRELIEELWDMEGHNVPPVIIVGRPGLGKTQVVLDFAKERNIPIVVELPSLLDTAGEIRGLPIPSDNNITFSYVVQQKFARFQQDRGIILLDELLQSKSDILRGVFNMLLTKRIGDCQLRPDTLIVATGNHLKQDNWVLELPQAFLNRLILLELQYNEKTFFEYAKNRFHPDVYEFLRNNKEYVFSLEDYNLTPRRWEQVSQAYELGKLNVVRYLLPTPIFLEFKRFIDQLAVDYDKLVTEILKTGKCPKWSALSITDKTKILEKLILSIKKDDLKKVSKFLGNIEDELAASTIGMLPQIAAQAQDDEFVSGIYELYQQIKEILRKKGLNV